MTNFISFQNALQFSSDNWKVQIMEIYQIENVIQFNIFCCNQLLIKSFFLQFNNSIIHIALVIFKYLLLINWIAKLQSITKNNCNSNTETFSSTKPQWFFAYQFSLIHPSNCIRAPFSWIIIWDIFVTIAFYSFNFAMQNRYQVRSQVQGMLLTAKNAI